jgi:hypothetical protein
MATASWATPILHDSDANFRIWGAEFNSYLAAVGMVQTADTGQIDWVTVLRPGVSTDAGYEIWRMNDTLQATAPIFVKFIYGTGSQSGYPRINMQVGTGSNGTGTLTGLLTTSLQIAFSASLSAGSFASYMCHTEGVFWLAWKHGVYSSATNRSLAGMAICRTCDYSGVLTADGATVINEWGSNAGAGSVIGSQHMNFLDSAVYSASLGNTSDAGNVTHTFIPSGAKNVAGMTGYAWQGWTFMQGVRPNTGFAGVFNPDWPQFTTFTANPLGAGVRTYMAVNSALCYTHSLTNDMGLALIWE